MIDYAEFQSAIGLNWYNIDPNLQFLMRRLLAPTDFDWLEPELRKIGALCGGPVAARAEVTDKHPPELVKFDRWGDPGGPGVWQTQALNLSAARAFAFAASSSRFFGGAFVSSARRRRVEMPAISSTAASNAPSFAFDGLLKPLIFLTNWSEAARISS
jgi:hypothetical protein